MLITDVKPQVKDKNRVSVFIDGKFSFGISEGDALYYKLVPNTEISEEKYDTILKELVFTKAKEKAVRFIGTGFKSRKEIADKLKKDFGEDIVEMTLETLQKYGYCDDKKYTLMYIKESYKYKKNGPLKIKYDLKIKGVEEEIVRECFEETEYDFYALALEVLEKKYKGEPLTDFKEKKKAFDFLMRKGFDYSVSKEAMAEYENQGTTD